MFISKLQKILAPVLTAAVLGGVGWSYGSHLMADPKPPAPKAPAPAVNEEPKKVPEEKAKPDLKKEDRITTLRKERLEVLNEQIKGLEARIQAGKDPWSTIVQAYTNLMDAELVLCSTQNQRIAVYEAALKRFKLIEIQKYLEMEAGQSPLHEGAQTKAARLEVEILLEQAKMK